MLGLATKSLGWFLAGVAVALGFLLVPLQVAAERKKLDRTVADIARAHRDIRALETEFETRANLAQLDRWNADTLKLVAPAAGQFVADEHALAAMDVAHPLGAGDAKPQMAFVPGTPTPVAVAVASVPPVPSPASATPPGPSAADLAPARVAPSRAAPIRSAPAREAMAAAPTRARSRAQAVALLDRGLLDDSLIGDLRSSARAERAR